MQLTQNLYTLYESIILNPALTGVLLATTILVIVLTIILLHNNANDDNDKNSKKDSKTTKTKSSSSPLKNIFSQMRRSASTTDKKPVSTDKPFSSSYYYAHNNPSTTGGYKDGLSLTDYTMNQPRLLSKNGVPVDDSFAIETNETKEEAVSDQTKNEIKVSSTQIKPSSIPITKFSWEDSHEYARIRIDSIPSPSNKSYISWEEASIPKSQVSIKLLGKRSLHIELQSSKFDQVYRLRFHNLYSDVKDAQVFWKSNKLIIRLKKVVQKEWKDLVKKDIAIDEDLFRSNE